MMHGGYAIDGKGIVYFAKGYSVSIMPRGPDCKGPTVGWTCKQFTDYNRNIGDNGEHATIYTLRSLPTVTSSSIGTQGGNVCSSWHTQAPFFRRT